MGKIRNNKILYKLKTNKKIVSIFLSVFLIYSLLVNVQYNISYEKHSCTQGNCEVCINIVSNVKYLDKCGNTLIPIAPEISLIGAKLMDSKNENFAYINHKTLVSLKVRLDI